MQNQGPTAGVEEFEGDRLIELSRHRHREPEPQVVQSGAFLLTVAVGYDVTLHDVEHVHEALEHTFHVGHVSS